MGCRDVHLKTIKSFKKSLIRQEHFGCWVQTELWALNHGQLMMSTQRLLVICIFLLDMKIVIRKLEIQKVEVTKPSANQ